MTAEVEGAALGRSVYDSAAPTLFEELTLREITFGNRIWLSPMCQYSAQDGVPDDWHLVHLGARATGGFGLVIAEATAVSPEARISLHDTGLWNDQQTQAWRRIVDFVHERGSRAGVQIAHAGRKASIYRPWDEGVGTIADTHGGWDAVSTDTVAFPGFAAPRALDSRDIPAIVDSFAQSARRAEDAGFDVLEIQAAHGFLIHSFLSPLSNSRTDSYGGSAENRARLLNEVVEAVRTQWPQHKPLFVRFSATDWLEGGLQASDIVSISGQLVSLGVDLIDVSSGGVLPAEVPAGPGYQVPLAAEIRQGSGLPVGALGLITEPRQAQQILAEGSADAVLLGRAALRDPMWPLRAAHELGVSDRAALWQKQIVRGDWP